MRDTAKPGSDPDVRKLLDSWGATFAVVRAQATSGRDLVNDALARADSEDAYTALVAEVERVRRDGEHALLEIDTLAARAESLRAEWMAAWRYQPDVLARRILGLRSKVAEQPAAGAREWLGELFNALDALEWAAVDTLGAAELPWGPDMTAGAEAIRIGLKAWACGDDAAGADLMDTIAEGELAGWQDQLGPELRARAHRLAAWVWLRRLKKAKRAREHLDKAVDLFPYAGRMHAERAAYYLSVGDLDHAVTDAQRAIELAADDEAGYWELGIWAELSGDFGDADTMYRKALALLPINAVARIHKRASVMDPPGRLLIIAGDMLLKADRYEDAVDIADQALRSDLRGTELHPAAPVHRLRSRALEHAPGRSDDEAAADAVEAGKLYLWNGDLDTAIHQFKEALRLDPDREGVGWLLADAQVADSLPLGEVVPDASQLELARATWDQSAGKAGLPKGDSSWAYLTRAIIADLASQVPGADRLEGVWEALLYVEKALVHDDVDAQRWGYAAQYLRYVHLDELAFECADRGYRIGSGDRQILAERLPRLVNVGRMAEAEEVAEHLVSMFGNDPWVSAARAWLAIHSDRPTRHAEALKLLDMPVAEGNDPSWYYEMRALCHVAIGDVDRARGDYEQLLEDSAPVDGTTKCRMSMAAIVLGKRELADHWLSEGESDPTSRLITCLSAAALIAFAAGDTRHAVSLLGRAIQHATGAIELEDIVEMTRLRLAVLDDDPATKTEREECLAGLESGPVAERARELKEGSPDPGRQLEDALVRLTGEGANGASVIATTLHAVRARRARSDGRLDEAAAEYESLLGSKFEPEATVALTKVLKRQTEERATAGDVSAVQHIQDRLRTLGDVTPAQSTIAVASAFEHAGRYSDARQALEVGILTARTETDRDELHQRAGGLALAENKTDIAAHHFGTALESAKERGDHGRVGQLEIRLALLNLRERDRPAAVVHLVAAVRAWRDAGALDPTAALLEELRGLVDRPRQGSWRIAANEALEIVEAASHPTSDASEPHSDTVALRRELEVRA
jgi:tetratricopeptide (TPR) repeat protein